MLSLSKKPNPDEIEEAGIIFLPYIPNIDFGYNTSPPNDFSMDLLFDENTDDDS
jgi:hypothetical protein